MNGAFHKFPHTPHLVWLGEGKPRDDKVLSIEEARAFLDGEVVVEEKVDGANLGLSVGSDGRIHAQSRGNYIAPGRSHQQWNLLWSWLASREHVLVEALSSEHILFGEWCYARHSVNYSALPDWFLAFDIFEPASNLFWSSKRRNKFVADLGITPMPEIFRGHLTMREVPQLIAESRLGAPRMEGVYLRRENGGKLVGRAKVVGGDFKERIEQHWTKRPLVQNRLAVQMGALARSSLLCVPQSISGDFSRNCR